MCPNIKSIRKIKNSNGKETMRELIVDKTKCTECLNCEILLPTFRKKYGGYILVSEHKAYTAKEEINSVINCCPNGAISLRSLR